MTGKLQRLSDAQQQQTVRTDAALATVQTTVEGLARQMETLCNVVQLVSRDMQQVAQRQAWLEQRVGAISEAAGAATEAAAAAAAAATRAVETSSRVVDTTRAVEKTTRAAMDNSSRAGAGHVKNTCATWPPGRVTQIDPGHCTRLGTRGPSRWIIPWDEIGAPDDETPPLARELADAALSSEL